MALPKIKHPVFTFEVPSSKKKIKMRPFTVREEKLLVIANEFSVEDVSETVIQVLNNCNLSSEIKIEKLSYFDVEFLFLKLRSKSVNEIIELTYKADSGNIDFELNLDDVKVKYQQGHSDLVRVSDDIVLKMRYPNFKDSMKIAEILSKEEVERDDDELFSLYTSSVQTVFDGEEEFSNFTKEEIEAFIMDIPSEALGKLYEFFETMPSLEHEIHLKTKDGEEIRILLRGLSGFFPH